MIDKKFLDQVARGIQAAERVRYAYHSSLRAGSGVPGTYDKVTMLNNVLAAITDYCPAGSRTSISEALETSSRYCSNYRNVKNHFRSLQGSKPGGREVANTLKVLSPMLGSRSSSTVDKILLLMEILNS